MRRLYIILSSIVLSSCASIQIDPPQQSEYVRSRAYNLDYEVVWSKAVDWFADNNLAIEKIEKTSGLLTAKYFIQANDLYLDCGKVNAHGLLTEPTIDKFGSLNVTVRKTDSNSSKVNVNFFGEFNLKGNDAWDAGLVTANGRCLSTGALEKHILDFIGS